MWPETILLICQIFIFITGWLILIFGKGTKIDGILGSAFIYSSSIIIVLLLRTLGYSL